MVSEAIRHQLMQLAASKRTRRQEFSPGRPTRWNPTQVVDPRDPPQVFTDAGAWDFIVEQLAGGTPIEELILSKPPGRTGYVMKVAGGRYRPEIYIKLELVPPFVYCRSFHYSEDRHE